nr:uncharacterized protein LOC106622802 isoform X4 [Bactrocera oleae]
MVSTMWEADLVKRHLLPVVEEQYSLRTDVIFQDDSAPCHRSHKVKEFLEKNGIVQLEWPGNSPDLNPIDNLWAVVKKQVAEKKPKKKTDLDNIIMDTWHNGISEELLQNLVTSMPRRIKAVIKANGGQTWTLPEYQDKVFVCNYRFKKEFTNDNVSDWTVNALNHFKPIDLVREK